LKWGKHVFSLSEWHKGLAEALAWPVLLADVRNEI